MFGTLFRPDEVSGDTVKVCPPGKRQVGPAPSNAGTFRSHQTGRLGGRALEGRRGILRAKKRVMEASVKPLCGERKNLQGRVNGPRKPRGGDFGRGFGEPLSALLVCLRHPSNPCPTFVTRGKKSGSPWGKDTGGVSAKPRQAHRLPSSPVQPRPRPSLPHQHLGTGPPCPGLRGAVALKPAPHGPALVELWAWGSHS